MIMAKNKIQDIVSIDGTYYNIKIPENGIKRSFSIADSDKAGRNILGEMIRDIVGTYYNYTIQFETRYLSHDEYDQLYEILSAPVDYHVITVPYGQSTLTFNAYVTGGSDNIKRIDSSGNNWTGLSIDFIAMKPIRT